MREQCGGGDQNDSRNVSHIGCMNAPVLSWPSGFLSSYEIQTVWASVTHTGRFGSCKEASESNMLLLTQWHARFYPMPISEHQTVVAVWTASSVESRPLSSVTNAAPSFEQLRLQTCNGRSTKWNSPSGYVPECVLTAER